ncbi:hypothetical protein PanWU01x14_157660, partial [Parasponia andersonii]
RALEEYGDNSDLIVRSLNELPLRFVDQILVLAAGTLDVTAEGNSTPVTK